MLFTLLYGKGALSSQNVVAHGSAGFLWLLRTNSAIDATMELERFAKVVGALDGVAPPLVHHFGNHLDECRQSRVAGCRSHSPVKEDVVDQILLRVIDHGVHLRQL